MNHRWTFFRAGGFDQVRFTSGADLLALPELDQKLWAALACPTRGIEFDFKTLDLIDADKDGRVRAPEVVAAVTWAAGLVKDPGILLKSSDSLALDAINDTTTEGAQVLASARQILANLGKAEATAISAADTADITKIFPGDALNGDGIVPAAAADDEATAAIITEIIACLGGDTDRSGQSGVTQARVDQFFADCQAFSEWSAKPGADPSILPLGEATAAGHGVFLAIKAKVDDFFGRTRLAAFDGRALAALNRQESEYLNLAATDLTITAAEISGFPLARIEAGRALPLKEGVNPAWAGALGKLQSEVIKPLLGEKATLTETEWATICGKFSAYAAWVGSKAGGSVEKLGLPRIAEILSTPARETISALITRDKSLESEANGLASVDKLVRLNRDLKTLLTNFVSFESFYSRQNKATFQAGTLYLDGRSCELCVYVHDAGKHALLAGMAKAYLAYCDCTRPGGEKTTIAAAFTSGDSDYLMAGRNGVFYDRKGRDWDATITKVIENPISVRQAFWSPYKKLVRLIEEQVAKRAAAADAASDKKLNAAATSAANADTTAAAKPAEAKKVDVGTVAAISVAISGIGLIVTGVLGQVFGLFALPFWMIVLAFCGILLVISGPSMLIAWLKLRQRNLGPILDANGWAINGRVKMNVPFGGSLTSIAKLPAGSKAVADDPFAERPPVWPKLALFVVVVCFLFSLLNHFGIIAMLKEKIGVKDEPALESIVSSTNTVITAEPTAATNAPASQ